MAAFIDIHVLQTVPPSNLNRDDTGSPKSAIYGGVRRARVSSQAWKRAVRQSFRGAVDESDLGYRTRQIVAMVAERARAVDASLNGQAEELAGLAVKALGLKLDAPRKAKKGEEATPESLTQYLVFLSSAQLDRLAEIVIACAAEGREPQKSEVQGAVQRDHGIEVALFGRMVADATELKVDAAVQVAHALSVHAVDTEFDYFTAVDDGPEADHAGAGMIGTVEFNSSTLYRYATVNIDGVQRNLGDPEASARAVGAFLRGFVMSMPTGKQNTFANRTLPDAVVVMLRQGQPVNLVGAFEEPVAATAETSTIGVACDRLVAYCGDLDRAFGTTASKVWVTRAGAATQPLASFGESVDLDQTVRAVGDAVRDHLRVPA
jgi:CRISPR system Cascade subunit CasC